ncbi:MAG TPA: hypothetical protein VKR82_06115 [Candidatus Acidoferrales bacterium]|nr:hypothetical protein [Candidatus Acidoferrales bacterium]
MNWKLIFQLSLFALAMGIATVFFIPSNIEPILCLVIFMICAYVFARNLSTGHFVHGLVLGLVNCVWVTSAHIILFDRYFANHQREAAMMATSPMASSPRLIMALVGPVVGIISGVVIGVFAFVAGKLIKPTHSS